MVSKSEKIIKPDDPIEIYLSQGPKPIIKEDFIFAVVSGYGRYVDIPEQDELLLRAHTSVRTVDEILQLKCMLDSIDVGNALHKPIREEAGHIDVIITPPTVDEIKMTMDLCILVGMSKVRGMIVPLMMAFTYLKDPEQTVMIKTLLVSTSLKLGQQFQAQMMRVEQQRRTSGIALPDGVSFDGSRFKNQGGNPPNLRM